MPPRRSVPVCLEVGAKRVFACALDWPGWARSGKTEQAALDALLGYATRYAPVPAEAGVPFPAKPQLEVVERLPGNATTEFGAPDRVATADAKPLSAAQAARLAALVEAAWVALGRAAEVAPAQLRKGPRGGGRDRDKLLAHVVGAEASYARQIGVRHHPPDFADHEAVAALRSDIAATLRGARSATPHRPNGWPPRYAARRIAWHALDHLWEMQDRTES